MTSLSGEMKLEMKFTLDTFQYEVWKSPLGFVVPYAQFQKYINLSNQNMKHANDRLTDCTEDMRSNTSVFQETVDYVKTQMKKTIDQLNKELSISKFALSVAVIAVVALSIILIVVII